MTLRQLTRKAMFDKGATKDEVDFALEIADTFCQTNETELEVPKKHEKELLRLLLKSHKLTPKEDRRYNQIMDELRGRTSLSA